MPTYLTPPRASTGAQIAEQHLRGGALVILLPAAGVQVLLEDDREGPGVGAVEVAERHHQHVEVEGIDAPPQQPLALAPAEQARDEVDEGRGHRRGIDRAAQEAGPQEVLAAEEVDELRVLAEVPVDEVEE